MRSSATAYYQRGFRETLIHVAQNKRSRGLNGSRHQEIESSKEGVKLNGVEQVPYNKNYVRCDLSDLHAFEARVAFARGLSRGEPGMNLAEAALLIAAEDDALASHSTVPFPVNTFMKRISNIAEELSRLHLPALCAKLGVQSTIDIEPSTVMQCVEGHLFNTLKYKMPPYGRSNLSPRTLYDHPGVYEDPRISYMNEVLIRKVGHPAALAILYSHVMRLLLEKGTVNFAVAVDTKGYTSSPHGKNLQLGTTNLNKATTTSMGLSSLNTCSSDVLAELLRHLKRTFWPFSWDTSIDAYEEGGQGSLGGFRAAAKVAAGEEMCAALAAISTVAAWRLERGIWTSTGAGDLRRAVSACRKLVLLDDAVDEERRDLSVLFMHSGNLAGAKTELEYYMSTAAFRLSDEFDKQLCYKIVKSLQALEVLPGDARLTTIQGIMDSVSSDLPSKDLPLTW